MRTTPSIVAVTDDGERLVGQPAKRQGVTNPERTFFRGGGSASSAAATDDPMVEKDKKLVPYKIVEGLQRRRLGSRPTARPTRPRQVSAFILQKMKESRGSPSRPEGRPGRHLPSPPTSTTPSARRPRTPARSRAFEVLRIINEPTAAALAYGPGQDRSPARSPCTISAAKHSSDISILEIGDGRVRGEVDQRRHLPRRRRFRHGAWSAISPSEFQKEPGHQPAQRQSLALQRLKEAAERGQDQAVVTDDADRDQPATFITADQTGPKASGAMKLTRAKFEALVDDLVQKIVEPCRRRR